MISKERATQVMSYVTEYGVSEASTHFGIPEETVNRYIRVFNQYAVQDSNKTSVEIASATQKLRDLNNVLRKDNRESYRLYNNLEELYEAYIELLGESTIFDFTLPTHPSSCGRTGIIQLSDMHLNELIESFESNGNSFDFTVASKRLHKFVTECKILLNAHSCTQVYVLCTGDLINSSRRLSEKMAQATSQVRASLLATYLIQQVIIDLAQEYTVAFAGVVGNESRIPDDNFETNNILASENWDYMIYEQLRMLFENTPVEFLETVNPIQAVITLDNGFNALITHGNFLKGVMNDKQASVLMQQYMYKGIPIHGVFIGHIHSANIGDVVSRSSSLCGGNAYSTNDLMFVSRASQNMYIINDDLSYNGYKIDLQNVDGYEGYNIVPELERYNVRNSFATQRVTIENLI